MQSKWGKVQKNDSEPRLTYPRLLEPFLPRSGVCKTVNDCYPKTKLKLFGPSDQWVMGSLDTCKYSGPTRSYVSQSEFASGLKNP